MAAIITEKFRQSNADAFFADLTSSKYYVFVGKSQPWTSEGATADSNPPNPVDSVAPESYYWDDMIAAKKVQSGNISFVVPRRDFSTSSAFDMYRHDVAGTTTSGNYPSKTTTSSGAINVFDSTFYFMTSAFRVYKVLYNGDQLQTGASNISGAEPTSEISAPFWHDNNYYIKFMYKLSTSQVQNFLTTDFMPVTVNSNEQVNRGVFVVMVTSGGSSYPNGTFYTKVKGDGSNAKVALVVSGGAITEFGQNNASNTYVSAPGSGYSFANIDLSTANIFTDANCTTAISGTQATNWTNATAGSITAIIEPAGGSGDDDIAELGGHFVMVQGKFEPSDADATQVNDFRRVGIVKNPTDTATNAVANITTARTTNAILMASGGSGNFSVDEKITQATTGAQGRVVEWDSTNKILYYVQEKYANFGLDTAGNLTLFSGANAVTGADSSASHTPSTSSGTTNGVVFASGYASPELVRDTGDIIYVENRRVISRASDQTEDIKVVVEF
tara:strand:+ start:855 stop:2360 length:1506 start_codon:yes stop_codon:yes gene_type:complete